MTADPFRFGLHVPGPTHTRREPVVWDALFTAACRADPPFDPGREQYLSAFRFDRWMLAHLRENAGSSAGYAGPAWSADLWFDLDAAELADALAAARRLAQTLLQRYPKLGDDDLDLFFTGKKGFHLGLPLPHRPDPGPLFHAVCRTLAVRLGRLAGVGIDESIYAKVQPLRLPNSRHPGTGLYKVRLGLDELMGLSPDGIRKLAAAPRPFDPPAVRVGDLIAELEHDWGRAEAAVGRRAADAAGRTADAGVRGGPSRLNRLTLEFIAGGCDPGSRHRRLYSAARNLGEFACPPPLAYALLMPPALDTGLAATDAGRQIDCGLAGSPPTEGG